VKKHFSIQQVFRLNCDHFQNLPRLKCLVRKEYLNIVIYNILDKILNSMIYRTLVYVNIYGS